MNARNWAWTFQKVARDCEYLLDTGVDGLNPIAEATSNSFVCHVQWQRHPECARTCPSDDNPALCTYMAWVARPATIHHRTLFRLTLSPKCVRALLRSRMGCHNLPKDFGCRKNIPRPQCFCNLCHIGRPRDEYHLAFKCQALQGVHNKYPDPFGEHAGTMLQFTWQATHMGLQVFSWNGWEEDANADPEMGQPSG